jgi:hypothetical protein
MHVVAILTLEMLRKPRLYTLGLRPCCFPRLLALALQFRLNLVPERIRTVDFGLPCSLTKNNFFFFFAISLAELISFTSDATSSRVHHVVIIDCRKLKLRC